ncbi:MAG: hypothetical protein ACXWWL_02395, partial [Candidatus Limnocylindria bacterium]
LPDRVLDAVLDELPATPQRRPSWLARRFPAMNNTAKLALAAAAVVVVAFLGIRFLSPGTTGIGGPGATPTPVPTPAATPAPLTEGVLEPGTYMLGHDLNTAITVPAGWENLDDRGVAKETAGGPAIVVVFWPFPTDLQEVYTDPCAWSSTIIQPPVGPTVDDLANALASQSMRGDPVPTDVTIDGYQGKLLEMTVPSDIDIATCDSGEFRSWLGRYHQGPGQTDRVYILDVNGESQVLISHHMPDATAEELAEQQVVFDSIDFLP